MSAKSIKKDSLAFLNELVACHRNSHKNEIKIKICYPTLSRTLQHFSHGGEGQDFRTLNRVNVLCLNFKLEQRSPLLTMARKTWLVCRVYRFT